MTEIQKFKFAEIQLPKFCLIKCKFYNFLILQNFKFSFSFLRWPPIPRDFGSWGYFLLYRSDSHTSDLDVFWVQPDLFVMFVRTPNTLSQKNRNPKKNWIDLGGNGPHRRLCKKFLIKTVKNRKIHSGRKSIFTGTIFLSRNYDRGMKSGPL